MIFQSKMNNMFFTKRHQEALKYLRCLRSNHWILIKQLPNRICLEVINMIDKGYFDNHKLELNELEDSFKIIRNAKTI